MTCPGCGTEYSPDNMLNFCPECGRKLTNYNEEIKKAPPVKEQFSFANTVYNVKCPSCKADNEIHHGFGYCSECKIPINLYINDDCQVAARGKSHNAYYSDLYSAPIPDRNGKKVPVEFIIFVIVILVVIVPIIFNAVTPDADTPDYYSSYTSSYSELKID